jgi:outer membrane biogenesis lipoprotein LolB
MNRPPNPRSVESKVRPHTATMKTRHLLHFTAVFFLSGCDRGTSTSGNATEWQEQQKRINAQIDDYDRQTKRVDEQQATADKQNQRFDKLLDKWEEQARRQDAILDAMEKQQAIRK